MIEFAKFEERNKEITRALAIYKLWLEILPRQQALKLNEAYTAYRSLIIPRRLTMQLIASGNSLVSKNNLCLYYYLYEIKQDFYQLSSPDFFNKEIS